MVIIRSIFRKKSEEGEEEKTLANECNRAIAGTEQTTEQRQQQPRRNERYHDTQDVVNMFPLAKHHSLGLDCTGADQASREKTGSPFCHAQ